MSIPDGTNNPYYARVSQKATHQYMNEASRALATDDISQAYNLYMKVLAIDPSHALALAQVKKIRAQAKELFAQAYVDRSSDPEKARRAFELVRRLVSDGGVGEEPMRPSRGAGPGGAANYVSGSAPQ